jgi:hypothetical protein
MARTIVEVQAELATVNAALQELISGRRLTQLRIGSGEFARLYQYQELTYENLKLEQQNLLDELSVLQTETSSVTLRGNSFIPLTVNKFMR